MNWKLTLAKSAVIGGLAFLGVWAADLQAVQGWWVAVAVVVVETVRDLIKTRYGQFVPNG